ncbi:MAG: tryptophan-rich sensory protein [Candidatus Pacebacteria bacterium]|nr:tryptophan-rich sensory protein [Candidatus Paceibacterota bacterium]
MPNAVKWIISVLICELAGISGSFFTAPAIKTWYFYLNKPSFSPPNWLFAPVWTTLFLLMGIALYLVWKRGLGDKQSKEAVEIFFLQLVLNVLWSVIFFGLKSPGLAFFEILILWAAIFYTMLDFFQLDKKAAYLLIPYIVWVSFASILNFFVWRLN